jgi:hypothetical protein
MRGEGSEHRSGGLRPRKPIDRGDSHPQLGDDIPALTLKRIGVNKVIRNGA